MAKPDYSAHALGGPEGYQALVEQVVSAIETQGYIILDDPFLAELAAPLFIDLQKTESHHFKPAGVGRGDDFQRNPFLRSDAICWLNPDWPPAQLYFHWMGYLKQGLNQALFLGLFDYECHYARYPQGAFYKTHLDAFQGRSNRRLSTVFYLNPEWQPGDGGELVIYHPDSGQAVERVLPVWGRLVIFLSDVFPHEVLPARRERVSLTGWYRVNGSIGPIVDPPR